MRRRKAFYAVAIMATMGNPVGLGFLWRRGRKLFRSGVKEASVETYKRWFGEA